MRDNLSEDKPSRWCVLLPCSKNETWAVPQNCLAEIVTLPAESEEPPPHFNWRGEEVLILDLDDSQESPWRDVREGTGLVAVMLGLTGCTWKYCGVALRGGGLRMKDLAGELIEDTPDLALETSMSAFRMDSEVIQVPNLQELYSRRGVQ